jgi:hypothetical protein
MTYKQKHKGISMSENDEKLPKCPKCRSSDLVFMVDTNRKICLVLGAGVGSMVTGNFITGGFTAACIAEAIGETIDKHVIGRYCCRHCKITFKN